MNKNLHFKAFVLAILLVPAIYLGLTYGLKKNLMDLIYPQETFLKLLKENRLDGCKLIKYQNPDVLFMGGSDSYTDWDYPMLQQTFSPLRVGGCIMAGMHNETVEVLLDVLTQQGRKFKLIILSINHDMFWMQDEDGFVATKENARYLKEMNDSYIRDLAMNFKEKFQVTPFIPYTGYEKDVMNYDQNWLDEITKKYPIKRDRSHDYVAKVPALCQGLKNLASHVIINHLPVNVFFESEYSTRAKLYYQKIIDAFNQCGLTVSKANGFANETRFYANRKALPEVSKALLGKDNQSFKLKQLFDLEHLNYVGAQKFTQWWINQHQHEIDVIKK